MSDRASIFDDSADFDVSGFVPQNPKAPKPDLSPEVVRAVSEKSDFRSREPAATKGKGTAKREVRRHRTGRNVQLNIKARDEAIASFYAIADSRGWVLGEVFERAIEALKRELKA
jgi:hypothetical protein